MHWCFGLRIRRNFRVITMSASYMLQSVVKERQIPVYYAGQLVGEYFADVLVNGVVLLELKVAQRLLDEHEAQLLNYLKATPVEVGLLLNFGPHPTFKRKLYDNDRKGSLAWTRME